MLTTAGISMLLSNTATTAMMVQIVKVILAELELGERRQEANTSNDQLASLEVSQNAAVSRNGSHNAGNLESETSASVSASAMYAEDDTSYHSCLIDTSNDRDVLKEFSR